jgi:hypothetical protein
VNHGQQHADQKKGGTVALVFLVAVVMKMLPFTRNPVREHYRVTTQAADVAVVSVEVLVPHVDVERFLGQEARHASASEAGGIVLVVGDDDFRGPSTRLQAVNARKPYLFIEAILEDGVYQALGNVLPEELACASQLLDSAKTNEFEDHDLELDWQLHKAFDPRWQVAGL